MPPKAKSRLLVRRPFSYLGRDGERITVARGAVVPDEVIRDPALRGRLIRTNYLYDPDHPEAMGVPAHRADRVAAELEAAGPLQSAPQDTPNEQLRDERRAARQYEIETTMRPWFTPRPPEPHPADAKGPVWGPDITRAAGIFEPAPEPSQWGPDVGTEKSARREG